MALQGGMLDRPATASESTADFPPEVIARMKQMGIWHPGLQYPLNSPRGREEAEIMANILNQSQRSNELSETRAYRQDAAEANRAQRALAQGQLDEYRQARLAQEGEAGKTRIAQTLQFMLNDPQLAKTYGKNWPAVQKTITDAMMRNTGIEPPTGTEAGVTTTKGEFGPGGAPTGGPPATQPVIPNTGGHAFNAGPPGAPMAGPGAVPVALPPSGGTNLETMAQEHPSGVGGGDPVNWMAYKRDIGGANFADIYGTSDPEMIKALLRQYKGGVPRASEIPDIYGGTPQIPAAGPRGYYKDGEYLGPAYTPEGAKIPKPKGATGIYGTADLSPEELVAMQKSPREFSKVTPHYPGEVAQGAVVGAQNVGMKPTNENMVAALAPDQPGYVPPTGAFATTPAVAPAPVPTPGPPVNLDVDKLLSQFVGGPTMEDLRRRRMSEQPVSPALVTRY